MTAAAFPQHEEKRPATRQSVVYALVGATLLIGGAIALSRPQLARTSLGDAIFGLPILLIVVVLQKWPHSVAARRFSWACLWLYLIGLAILASAYITPGRAAEPIVQRIVVLGSYGLAVIALLGLAGVLASTGWWLPVARFLAFGASTLDARRALHAQASVGFLFFIGLAATVQLAHGGPPLEVAAAQLAALGASTTGVSPGYELAYLSLLAWGSYIALFGAGLPALRDVRGALVRLGIGQLSRGKLVRLLPVALFLPVLGTLFFRLTVWLWFVFGWPVTDTRLLAAASAPPVAKWSVWRGLLLARFGRVVPSLRFAAIHALRLGGRTRPRACSSTVRTIF